MNTSEELALLPAPPNIDPREVDLETVLNAWQSATTRLQKTHQTLCAEVSRLSDELENKSRELARKNRLADLGQMASHVAHEVRNCLMPMTLYLSLLRRRLADDAENLGIVDKLKTGFTALEATVNDLLNFTAHRDPIRRPCAVHGLVVEVLDGLSPQLQAQGIRAEIDVAEGDVLLADQDMLRRAVLNLVLNAVDAMPEGGDLTITSCHTPERYELEIADSGPGIDESMQSRVFEPFFTTKQGGTGLGLAIVGRIVEVHGGDVTAQNCPQGGAAFTLRFPQQRAMEAAA